MIPSDGARSYEAMIAGMRALYLAEALPGESAAAWCNRTGRTRWTAREQKPPAADARQWVEARGEWRT